MSEAEDTREGLASLLADVLSEGFPDPALLVQYADDPSALSSDERQMVERRLAESPRYRDQLKVLKDFDFRAADELPGAAARPWLPNPLGWVRRLFHTRPLLVWVPASVVAVLVLLLVYPRPTVPEDLVIATATKGGTYIVVGNQMARILTEYPVEGIGKVQAVASAGSFENIDGLLAGTTQLALLFGPTLVTHPRRSELGVLLVLYHDIWQVLVHKSTGIQQLSDLKSRRLFVGPGRSATRSGATRMLESAGILESDYTRVDVASYGEASALLQAGEADAVFFLIDTPAVAVKEVMSSGCCMLLDLPVDSIRKHAPDLWDQDIEIPPYTYPDQPLPIRTVGASVLLVARKDLDDEIVSGILNTVFDHLSEFEVANIRMQDVRFDRAFDLPEQIDLHAGAARFKDREMAKLWIATGVINGSYFNLGRRMQGVLEQRGIPARVIHTDGSVENLNLLRQHERVIAITQYDAALASLWADAYGGSELYSGLLNVEIPRLRRIAALHDETVHVLIRRDRLAEAPSGPLTLRALEDARVCLGAPDSGTQVLARSLLEAHGVTPITTVTLPIPEMVARINSGELDAGFLVGAVPNQAIRSLLEDQRNRLLSVDPRSIVGLLGSGVVFTTIPTGTYGAQLEGEPPIATVATRAALVTRTDLSLDVRRITEALFEGAAFLRVAGGVDTMAQDLPSLQLHVASAQYYRDAGLSQPEEKRDWLRILYASLGTLVILIGGCMGLVALRRHRTRRNLTHSILGEVRSLQRRQDLDRITLRERYASIEEGVWAHWENGGLDPPQHSLLLSVIHDSIRQTT